MPSVASASAPTVSELGRSPTSASAITGASTEETATMNADREGVVITSPAVCAMNPKATRSPRSAPPRSSEGPGRGSRRVPGSKTSAASPKRIVRNASGVAYPSALLTATKLVPQSAVASRSASVVEYPGALGLATRPVPRGGGGGRGGGSAGLRVVGEGGGGGGGGGGGTEGGPWARSPRRPRR